MTIPSDSIIAVTGGTGSLGRRFVTAALTRGLRLRLLSRAGAASLDSERLKGIEHRRFDLSEPFGAAVLDGCNMVVHLAAHIPRNHSDPAEAVACLMANGAGTARLLEAAEQAGISYFIHTTAANAYVEKERPIDETGALFPARRSPFYLASKVVQDIFAEHWRLKGSLEVATLRVSSLYGVGQSSGAITAMARTLLSGDRVRLAGGGGFSADFVTVDDVVDALLLFLSSRTGGTFNIASGRHSTIREVADCLATLTGAGSEYVVVDGSAPDAGFPAVDISRALACGFRPTGLADGLKALVAWLDRAQPD